jgi:hypothetical protein
MDSIVSNFIIKHIIIPIIETMSSTKSNTTDTTKDNDNNNDLGPANMTHNNDIHFSNDKTSAAVGHISPVLVSPINKKRYERKDESWNDVILAMNPRKHSKLTPSTLRPATPKRFIVPKIDSCINEMHMFTPPRVSYKVAQQPIALRIIQALEESPTRDGQKVFLEIHAMDSDGCIVPLKFVKVVDGTNEENKDYMWAHENLIKYTTKNGKAQFQQNIWLFHHSIALPIKERECQYYSGASQYTLYPKPTEKSGKTKQLSEEMIGIPYYGLIITKITDIMDLSFRH